MVLSMERWVGKVVIVTGASAGIGAAIVKQLVENGMIVAGMARRKDKIEQIAKELKGAKGQLHAVQCDVSKEEDIINAFNWVSEKLGPVHVLVNNAGIVSLASLSDGPTEEWKKVFDTNVLGLCVGTREAVRIMKVHNIDGHIIHMNSIAGHYVPNTNNSGVYAATKHAVTALTEVLGQEFVKEKLGIRVTSISPGVTETDIARAAGLDVDMAELVGISKVLDPDDIADSVVYALSTPPHVQSISPGVTETDIVRAAGLDVDMAELVGISKVLDPDDIADSVVYALSTPPHVEVKEIIVKPIGEPF